MLIKLTESVILLLMEKLKAHYDLAAIQALVADKGVVTFTNTARSGAMAMGLTVGDALTIIAGITRGMLYKSMTTFADHTVWQDVYHVPVGARTAYIKLTLIDDKAVIQFKEK